MLAHVAEADAGVRLGGEGPAGEGGQAQALGGGGRVQVLVEAFEGDQVGDVPPACGGGEAVGDQDGVEFALVRGGVIARQGSVRAPALPQVREVAHLHGQRLDRVEQGPRDQDRGALLVVLIRSQARRVEVGRRAGAELAVQEPAYGAGRDEADGIRILGQLVLPEQQQRHPRDLARLCRGQEPVPRQAGGVEVDVREGLAVGADGIRYREAGVDADRVDAEARLDDVEGLWGRLDDAVVAVEVLEDLPVVDLVAAGVQGGNPVVEEPGAVLGPGRAGARAGAGFRCGGHRTCLSAGHGSGGGGAAGAARAGHGAAVRCPGAVVRQASARGGGRPAGRVSRPGPASARW
ncbi:hypothetical protein AB0I22_14105 [Streptomyces sp. NPDC050610]|uniref:hypothetical protein n=1 Tax=Streptomyces sp. NPDC050610 TaxID=3157097 RepID=UPI003422D772